MTTYVCFEGTGRGGRQEFEQQTFGANYNHDYACLPACRLVENSIVHVAAVFAGLCLQKYRWRATSSLFVIVLDILSDDSSKYCWFCCCFCYCRRHRCCCCCCFCNIRKSTRQTAGQTDTYYKIILFYYTYSIRIYLWIGYENIFNILHKYIVTYICMYLH